jgi:formylglycine-generating enzyme required for sulfatase activity
MTNKIDVAAEARLRHHASAANRLLPPYYKLVKKASLQVGRGPANAWGLYGMHGNAEEWCLDWYAPYDPSQTTDPVGPVDGDFRVVRGGANSHSSRGCCARPTALHESLGAQRESASASCRRIPLHPTVKALQVPP